MFKIVDRIIAIEDSKFRYEDKMGVWDITDHGKIAYRKGDIYNVIDIFSDEEVVIFNYNFNAKMVIYTKSFITLAKYRNQKLNEILNV